MRGKEHEMRRGSRDAESEEESRVQKKVLSKKIRKNKKKFTFKKLEKTA